MTTVSSRRTLFSLLLGTAAVLAAPSRAARISDWNFRYHDAGGNTQGTQVIDGQEVADGDLYNSAAAAPAESANQPWGHLLSGKPLYATYDISAEGLAAKPGADGFALDTRNGQYPFFSDAHSALEVSLVTNGTFSLWARAKRTADSATLFEAVVGRPTGWWLGVDGDGTIAVEFASIGGVNLQDTGIAWPTGTWHEVGFTYDGTGAGDGTVTVYVDGTPALPSFTPPAFGVWDVFHIGNGSAATMSFDGLIDRVLFWDESVDAQTMQALSTPATPVLTVTTGAASGIGSTWDSVAGMAYALRASAKMIDDPAGWPVHGGHAGIAATPPENVLVVPFPGDTRRFFVVTR